MKQKVACFLVSLLASGLVLAGCASQTNHVNHGNHQQENHQHGGTQNQVMVHTGWKFAQEPLVPGKAQKLTIDVYDHNGKPIEDFEINHEKKMHLIVISKDLSHFDHVHPEFKGNGKFDTTIAFPQAGDYRLIADFIPKGASQTVQVKEITVQGTPPKAKPLVPDQQMTKTADGKEITLTFDHQVETNKPTVLTFQIKDAKSKQPIALEPYLGAKGHVVIISKDLEQYLHVHPLDDQTPGQAKFETSFPKSGIYKLWGEFQHQGKVFRVSYVIKVS